MANATPHVSTSRARRSGLAFTHHSLIILVLLLAISQQAAGQGFSTTATPWVLPPGGYATASHEYSYSSLTHTANTRSALDHTWATLDMNGDAKPDLVVLTEGNGTYDEPFGTGTTGRYWKVYLNTGAGYAATATTWALPVGDAIASGSGHLLSFNALEFTGTSYTGNQGWAVRDINGDTRPDLIVLTEGTGIYNDVLSAGTTRYWRVYLNTGTGFAPTATIWTLPAGGYTFNSHDYSFNTLANNTASQKWSVMDMNGDSRPDLVVISQEAAVLNNNTVTDHYWKIYLGTGTGFEATAILWALPAGGLILRTAGIGAIIPGGFVYLSNKDLYVVGDQRWETQDFNGDGRPDLVITAEQNSNYDEAFGTGTSRSWKVYLNTSTGFSSTAITWALPAGGLIGSGNGHLYSFNASTGTGSPLIGNQHWAVRDLNGDAKPDLVVLAEGNGTYSEPFGTGTARSWKVYLNMGTGFSTAATNWALPTGGLVSAGHNYSFSDLTFTGSYVSSVGSQTWSVLDMNGDAKPDLTVLTEESTTSIEPFGTGTNRYWNVYLNAATTLATRAAFAAGTLDVFPNPTRRTFSLRLPALANERAAQLTLLNSLGQQVLARSLSLNPAGTQTEVDVSVLPAGLYTLRIVAGSQTATQKVIVE